MSSQHKIALSTFIGLTMALCATVRSIPTLAAAGWTLLVYIIFAVLFFAAPIAFIVAGYAMNQWLQDFAYRTSLSWWVFLLAAILAAIVALVTISFQAIKAALANPVKSLRSE